MMKKTLFTCSLFWGIFFIPILGTKAQTADTIHKEDINYQMYLEDLLEETEELDLIDYLNYIDELLQNPLDINYLAASDLKPLLFLTAMQIENLMHFKRVYGKFYDLYTLQAVPGFDLATVLKLTPLLKINSRSAISKSS